MGSSRTRDRTRVPYIGRRILNHCATREVPQCLFVCNILIHYIWKEKTFKSNLIIIWRSRYRSIGINNLWQTYLSATYNVKLTCTQQRAAPCLPLGLWLKEPSLHFQYSFNHFPVSFTGKYSFLFYFIRLQLFSLCGSRPKEKNEQGYYVFENPLKGYITLNIRVIFLRTM